MMSIRFLQAYVSTMRPYLMFVSGITGIVGMSLVPGVPAAPALALSAVFFLSYGFGQALTDCFQLDTDAISAPWRPMIRATLLRSRVLAVSLAGLLAVGAALIAANPWNLPLVGAMVAGLATYTPFKRRWWAGPPWNSWIVALVCASGVLAALGLVGTTARPADLATPSVAGTLIAVFFGYMNFVLAGYFKDIDADRATGYRTLPVVFGRKASAILSDLLALAALAGALVAMLSAPGLANPTGLVLAGAGLLAGTGLSLVAQLRLHRVRNDATAYRAIVPVVQSYLLTLAAVACAHRPDWTGPLALFVAAGFVAIGTRPHRSQV
jgi:4-hydroxybenzoate polyprenyltransferase